MMPVAMILAYTLRMSVVRWTEIAKKAGIGEQ
jgi:hypothetical protein